MLANTSAAPLKIKIAPNEDPWFDVGSNVRLRLGGVDPASLGHARANLIIRLSQLRMDKSEAEEASGAADTEVEEATGAEGAPPVRSRLDDMTFLRGEALVAFLQYFCSEWEGLLDDETGAPLAPREAAYRAVVDQAPALALRIAAVLDGLLQPFVDASEPHLRRRLESYRKLGW